MDIKEAKRLCIEDHRKFLAVSSATADGPRDAVLAFADVLASATKIASVMAWMRDVATEEDMEEWEDFMQRITEFKKEYPWDADFALSKEAIAKWTAFLDSLSNDEDNGPAYLN